MLPAIRVANLTKSFRAPSGLNTVKSLVVNWGRGWRSSPRQTIFKNLNFEVQPGEFFGIVGSNGSGKSSLLKILAGIYQADQGRIELSGPVIPLIEIGAGLQPELSGRDNLYLGGAFIGLSPRDIRRLYPEIVAFAGLENDMDKKLKNYSSGMQIRLAFSLMTRGLGDIILIDEVLAVGDEDFQQKCWRHLAELKRQGRTVVLVTHDMEALKDNCDRAMLLANQGIASQGSPAKVAAAYHQQFNPKTKQP